MNKKTQDISAIFQENINADLIHSIGTKLAIISCRTEWILINKDKHDEIVKSSKLILDEIDETVKLLKTLIIH